MASKADDFTPAPGLTVIMPFRDEEATLHRALDQLLAVKLDEELEVIVVDDGSTDMSLRSISDLLQDPRVRLIHRERGVGKGHAVRSGLSLARSPLIAILDADLEYDARDLATLHTTIRSGDAAVVYGARPLGRDSFYSFWFMVGGRLTSLWASLLFMSRVRDMHTSLKIAPSEVWRTLDLRRNGFDLDSEITAKLLRSGHRILEIPVSYKARTRAQGKKLRWTAGLKSLWVVTAIRMSRINTAETPELLDGTEEMNLAR